MSDPLIDPEDLFAVNELPDDECEGELHGDAVPLDAPELDGEDT